MQLLSFYHIDINNVLIRLGIKIERGAVAAIAVDSSAAKNGLLIGHHIIGNPDCFHKPTQSQKPHPSKEKWDGVDLQTISIKVVYLQKLGVSAWLGYQTKSLADSLRKAARSRIQLKLNIICTILKDWPGLCDSSLNAQNLKNKKSWCAADEK